MSGNELNVSVKPLETIAKLLWERFSPEHEVEWPSAHSAEYRLAAADVLSALSPQPTPNVEGSPLLEWAVERWIAQVKHRPLVNVHRRSLDDVWRQVIRWAGGDPASLVGPSHDELLSTSEENR